MSDSFPRRQTRSVQWAARVIELQVPDVAFAARLVAVLELLLTRPLLEEALECTEGNQIYIHFKRVLVERLEICIW